MKILEFHRVSWLVSDSRRNIKVDPCVLTFMESGNIRGGGGSQKCAPSLFHFTNEVKSRTVQKRVQLIKAIFQAIEVNLKPQELLIIKPLTLAIYECGVTFDVVLSLSINSLSVCTAAFLPRSLSLSKSSFSLMKNLPLTHVPTCNMYLFYSHEGIWSHSPHPASRNLPPSSRIISFSSCLFSWAFCL